MSEFRILLLYFVCCFVWGGGGWILVASEVGYFS